MRPTAGAAALCQLYRIEMKIVAAEVNHAAGDERRRVDVASRVEPPQNLTGLAVDRVEICVVAADVDPSIGHGWRRFHQKAGFEPPLLLAGSSNRA